MVRTAPRDGDGDARVVRPATRTLRPVRRSQPDAPSSPAAATSLAVARRSETEPGGTGRRLLDRDDEHAADRRTEDAEHVGSPAVVEPSAPVVRCCSC